MAAGAHGRTRFAARDLAALPGWMQLTVTLALVATLCVVAHVAGVPGRWAPLVIGGGLGLATAVVTGVPREDEPLDGE